METVLALSNENTLRKLRARLKTVQLDLASVHNHSALPRRLEETHADLVLLDIKMPPVSSGEALRSMLEHAPNVPILVIDVADCDVTSLRGLFKKHLSRRGQRSLGHSPVDPLFHRESGRIDARQVAKFFGFSLSKLAKTIGYSVQAVHKTPDAERLQNSLGVFVRIAAALMTMFESEHNARVWLNAPNPDLDNVPPMRLLEQGKSEIVAELLEDALLGHPG